MGLKIRINDLIYLLASRSRCPYIFLWLLIGFISRFAHTNDRVEKEKRVFFLTNRQEGRQREREKKEKETHLVSHTQKTLEKREKIFLTRFIFISLFIIILWWPWLWLL